MNARVRCDMAEAFRGYRAGTTKVAVPSSFRPGRRRSLSAVSSAGRSSLLRSIAERFPVQEDLVRTQDAYPDRGSVPAVELLIIVARVRQSGMAGPRGPLAWRPARSLG